MSDTEITSEKAHEESDIAARWEEQKALAIAQNMINLGFSFETVVLATQLDPEKVKTLYDPIESKNYDFNDDIIPLALFYLLLIKENSEAFLDVPDYIIDKGFCFVAAFLNGSVLQSIPRQYIDEELCILAALRHEEGFEYIPEMIKPKIRKLLKNKKLTSEIYQKGVEAYHKIFYP